MGFDLDSVRNPVPQIRSFRDPLQSVIGGGEQSGRVPGRMRRRKSTNNTVILRRPRALARGRLEGWPQTRSLLPSFETLGASRRAPQDDDSVYCASNGNRRGHAALEVKPYDDAA